VDLAFGIVKLEQIDPGQRTLLSAECERQQKNEKRSHCGRSRKDRRHAISD